MRNRCSSRRAVRESNADGRRCSAVRSVPPPAKVATGNAREAPRRPCAGLHCSRAARARQRERASASVYKGPMATRVKRGRSGGNGLEQPDQVLYVYAMTRGPSKPLTKLQAVDGAATVESLTIGDYSCWISRVSKREFADELQQNMQNLDWLAAAGVRHQQIVSAIA